MDGEIYNLIKTTDKVIALKCNKEKTDFYYASDVFEIQGYEENGFDIRFNNIKYIISSGNLYKSHKSKKILSNDAVGYNSLTLSSNSFDSYNLCISELNDLIESLKKLNYLEIFIEFLNKCIIELLWWIMKYINVYCLFINY